MSTQEELAIGDASPKNLLQALDRARKRKVAADLNGHAGCKLDRRLDSLTRRRCEPAHDLIARPFEPYFGRR